MAAKPKHILHLMPYQAVGGTETAAKRIAGITRESGYRNTFLCLNGCSGVISFFRDNGFDVIEHPEIQPSITHPSGYWRDSRTMARKFKEMRVDLIHAQDYSGALSYTLAAMLARTPLISHVRNKHDHISKRDQIFLRPVKHWIFVSRETRDAFAFKINPGKGTVIYDGVKIEEIDGEAKKANRTSVLKEFGLDHETKLIGMIARVAPQKDFFTLADAVRKLSEKHDSLKILIVGDTSKEESTSRHFKEVSEYISKLGISEKFIFTGYRTDVGRLIDAMDAHVLSTHFEGFALVNLEVMSHGVPTISTMSGSSREITEHGKNGLLFEHQNSGELAARIEDLIVDPDLAVRIGEAGFQTVKDRFSHERFSTEILSFYKRMLN